MLRTPTTAIQDWQDAGILRLAGVHYDEGVPVYVLHCHPGEDLNRLDGIVASTGATLRFDDEIITDNNGRAHELHPGYYGETPTYAILSDGQVWARDDVDGPSRVEEYANLLMVDTSATGRGLSADRWSIDFAPLGFMKFDYEAESGFHPGQTDTPKLLLEMIHEKHGICDVIFSIDDVGQFDVHFSAWFRPRAKGADV